MTLENPVKLVGRGALLVRNGEIICVDRIVEAW